jgi:hypothetical protein
VVGELLEHRGCHVPGRERGRGRLEDAPDTDELEREVGVEHVGREADALEQQLRA